MPGKLGLPDKDYYSSDDKDSKEKREKYITHVARMLGFFEDGTPAKNLETAKKILKLAGAALGIVVKIKQNTLSIWGLQDTNHTAVKILNEADTILSNAGAVATALHETEKQS